ncbi:M56 family metallopeptidase [Streptomyces sp. JV176]|uniref:M56 family metallopeptidase n=1 Tax=Streptomyces sp. JV176 TaxID=858630 RepID=UPI002E77E889|nr:M56 family metallopeptidase [Streptomyces sp. JV176]MEE1800511.1 M56 family metallopeptidase [Streptomyces sp. JV176]
MGTPAARSRIDERAMGAGTTVRFALLVALLLAAGGAMMLPAVNSLHSSDRVGCQLALGIDPDRSGDMASAVNALSQAVPYEACMARYAPPPAQWQIFGWPVLLSAAAVLLFTLLPVLKARRRRAVPLESVDKDGELKLLLAELAETAGLARLPRVVVDRASVTTGAVVFGRNRRPVVCLYGGLLACRATDPERFRAVLLHEFAHIANRDITVTYGTVALWRVFLALVLVPYLVWESTQVRGVLRWGTWSTDAPALTRGLLLPVLTVALVHLARSDVLRSREVYADLAAVRWGANPRGWDATTRAPEGGRLRRALGALREHWGTHPRWEERRDALADPAPLFGARALPVFLTGAAASMVNFHLLTYLSTYNMYSLWRVQLVALAPAALVAGVIGTALWRTVAYAVLTGDPVPSGVRTGLWLGAGLGAGGLFTGYGMGGSEWLPQRPAVLLLVLGAGVAFAWWVTRCAHLWANTWRGRSLRPPLLIGLVSSTLVLAAWFAWWTMDGWSWAAGASYNSTGMRQTALRMVPGADVARQGADAARSAMVSAVVTARPVLNGSVASPLIPAAIAALWLTPLAAWAIGRAPGTPRWVAGALPGGGRTVPAGEPVPPLRRALRPGLLGGAVCWLALVGVQAYLHTSQPGPQQRDSVYEVRYLVWLFVVLVGAAVVAAVVAGVRTGRAHRLAGTLIAAESAALLGIAGMILLVSADGCVEPLNTLRTSCSWQPAWQSLRWTLPYLINGPLALAAIIAFLVAAAGSTVGRARRRWARPAGGAGGPRPRSAGQAPGARGLGVRLGAGGLAAAAVGIAVVMPLSLARFHTLVPDAATAQSTTRQWSNVTAVPVSTATRARQVHAWHRLGGRYLLEHAAADYTYLGTVLRTAADTKNANLTYLARLRPTCADFGRIAGWVNGAYFRVPDPEAQSAWQALGTQAWNGSVNCERALRERDYDLFATSLGELIAAGKSAEKVTTRVNTVLSEAGYKN